MKNQSLYNINGELRDYSATICGMLDLIVDDINAHIKLLEARGLQIDPRLQTAAANIHLLAPYSHKSLQYLGEALDSLKAGKVDFEGPKRL